MFVCNSKICDEKKMFSFISELSRKRDLVCEERKLKSAPDCFT